ncbi:Snf7 family protein [Candidatus Bathyarchaeota archaeon]|nr:Snf7 family protein [Candidatus Bathyarchaeota archaeon]
MSNAIKSWERNGGKSSLSKLSDGVKKQAPLRERISYTVYKLKTQSARLQQSERRMTDHYNELFRKCTNSVMAKDTTRASMYANECAEVKKMSQTIVRSMFAIEQVILRLETIEEFGDVVVTMNPIAGVINSLRGSLAGIVPEVSYTLGEIGDSMNNMVVESGGVTAISTNTFSANEESERILTDANAIAEQRMKEKFPTLPSAESPTLEGTS